jgi:hypothetical protein
MKTRMSPVPRIAAAVVTLALSCAYAGGAGAVETRADVETDHVDAADDGGPRSGGVLVHSLPLPWGSIGAEVDVALGANVALSVDGEWLPFGATRVFAALLGLPIFPQRFSFHGLYVHPRFEWAWASAQGSSVQVGAAAVLVGYEWTWAQGATLRLAGGPGYSRATGGDAALSSALVGFHPELDAALGWIF